MKIDLPLSHMSGDRNWIVVKAKIVDVAPHLAGVATFAVHKTAPFYGRWRITNVETGACISECDADSKEVCVMNAILFLEDKTPKQIEARYREWLAASK